MAMMDGKGLMCERECAEGRQYAYWPCRGTEGNAQGVGLPDERPTDISVRQFVADSGSVTRGLRQGRTYTLTLNGEPLARMVPIRGRQAVSRRAPWGSCRMDRTQLMTR
jgi:antitoxin (DNA-binding transcriptional repressor) of toxin-antitoxin stability system